MDRHLSVISWQTYNSIRQNNCRNRTICRKRWKRDAGLRRSGIDSCTAFYSALLQFIVAAPKTFDDHQRVSKDRASGVRRSLRRLKRTALPSNPPKPALTAIQSPGTQHAATRRQRSCYDRVRLQSGRDQYGPYRPSPLSLSLSQDITPEIKRERVMTALPCIGRRNCALPMFHPSMKPSLSSLRLLLKARSLSTAFQTPSQPGSAPRSLHPGNHRDSGVS